MKVRKELMEKVQFSRQHVKLLLRKSGTEASLKGLALGSQPEVIFLGNEM
jgi:hypothetical protein